MGRATGDEGRLVEEGTHDRLLTTGGVYARLYLGGETPEASKAMVAANEAGRTVGPGAPRQAAPAGMRDDENAPLPPSSRRDARERGASGTHEATGATAQAPAQAPPSYTARIALKSDTIAVDGRAVRPTPGVTVTVDVRTGERRLIEFVLQPVLRYAAEGLRER